MFTIDFNEWKGIMDSFWNGKHVVRFQQGNMKHNMDSHKTPSLTWKAMTLICFTMRNGLSL